MREALLRFLTCPACTSVEPLRLNGDLLPLVEASVAFDLPSIVEGTIACTACLRRFPIVQGVPILVPEIEDYLSARKPELVEAIAREPVSRRCRELILSAKESLYGTATRRESWDTMQGLEMYFRHHYAEFLFAANDPLGDVLTTRETIYSTIAKRFFLDDRRGTLVDLGCGVGGNIYRLGGRFDVSLGTDLSFSAIKVASDLFELGRLPTFYTSGALSQRMPAPEIQIERVNEIDAHFFVADATHLPVAAGSVDAAVLCNIIDIASEPSLLLHEASRMVLPGGSLLVVTPFYWRVDRTPPSKWLESEDQAPSQMLERLLLANGFGVQETLGFLPWIHTFYHRYAQVWLCDAILSTRIGVQQAAPNSGGPA
jgi:SAM-dependent methyltransferase/uncharacterized protein YbaR (Trm112 family)